MQTASSPLEKVRSFLHSLQQKHNVANGTIVIEDFGTDILLTSVQHHGIDDDLIKPMIYDAARHAFGHLLVHKSLIIKSSGEVKGHLSIKNSPALPKGTYEEYTIEDNRIG
jgi:hypothetical protein